MIQDLIRAKKGGKLVSALHRTRGEAIEGKPRPVGPLGEPGEAETLDLRPADTLSAEHDVIRRVLRALERQSVRIKEWEEVDGDRVDALIFLTTVVDFISTYAGRVHHGKEEEILFRRLDDEDLSTEHRQVMEQLAEEHVEMRHATESLREAKDRYREGDEEALDDIVEALDTLVHLYPGHMATEEEDFFPAAMDYLDDEEQRALLVQMRGHDRAMIHEAYGSLSDELEATTEDWALRE
jgi:hemerythrin-like domain-containing protein